MILNRTVTLVCVAVPLFVNRACGVIVPLGIVEPLAGVTNATAPMSFAAGGTPMNSSAPMSGVLALRISPSMSRVTPAFEPPDSNRVAVAAGICRSEFDTNGGATIDANDALSFVPAADNGLVYARQFAAGVVCVGSKFSGRYSAAAFSDVLAF